MSAIQLSTAAVMPDSALWGNSGRGNTGYWPRIAEAHLTGMTTMSPDFVSSPVARTVKHLPAMRETWVQSLGWEDPLEKEMAMHSSTFAWKIPWTEEPSRLWSMGSQRVRHDWATSLSLPFPTHRKGLISLTWDVWFSLIINNLLMFWLPALCCKNSHTSWLFRAVAQCDLRLLSPGLKALRKSA